MSASEHEDLEAASAAVAAVGEEDLYHINEAGDPLLRTGLLLGFSVRVVTASRSAQRRRSWTREITFPMIGTVAEGMTLQQQQLLEERYGNSTESPISLGSITTRRRISLGARAGAGRVKGKGGSTYLPRDLTVSRAIQVSGGYAPAPRRRRSSSPGASPAAAKRFCA